tara:strand:- start:1037 stop:1597 length:561 start_codon:yes stop_codon:yes gene_type:complete
MKRFFDFTLAIILIIALFGVMLGIALAIKLSSKGPVLYWSDRVGRENIIFRMPKFRSMHTGTPSLASHLMSDPTSFLTPMGAFLRRSSFDELPQLYSVLSGKMSFVGPRPALFNQDDLIKLRSDKGVLHLKPGVTGWAQVNGRDELSIEKKVVYEEEYLRKRSFVFDLYIIWLTLIKVLKGDGVSH